MEDGLAEIRDGCSPAGPRRYRHDDVVGMAADSRKRGESDRGKRNTAVATGNVRGIHDSFVCCWLRHRETGAAGEGDREEQWGTHSLQGPAGE